MGCCESRDLRKDKLQFNDSEANRCCAPVLYFKCSIFSQMNCFLIIIILLYFFRYFNNILSKPLNFLICVRFLNKSLITNTISKKANSRKVVMKLRKMSLQMTILKRLITKTTPAQLIIEKKKLLVLLQLIKIVKNLN